MNPFEKTTATLMSGLEAQAFRMRIVSENLANADTHGYRRKLVTFANVFDAETEATRVRIGRVDLDRRTLDEIYEPSHPFANAEGYVATSNVDMLTEFADAREAQRSYEAGLEVFRQARDMYASLLELLKR